MSSLSLISLDSLPNPLDIAEEVIIGRNWAFDRPGAEELVAEVAGTWCHYRVWLAWQESLGALAFTCAFDTKIPASVRPKLYTLLGLVNERIWAGHFDLCSEEGTISFRHTLLLRGKGATNEQLEDLLDIAMTECERFYPALQSMIWAGREAQEALDMAMFDTAGEA